MRTCCGEKVSGIKFPHWARHHWPHVPGGYSGMASFWQHLPSRQIPVGLPEPSSLHPIGQSDVSLQVQYLPSTLRCASGQTPHVVGLQGPSALSQQPSQPTSPWRTVTGQGSTNGVGGGVGGGVGEGVGDGIGEGVG